MPISAGWLSSKQRKLQKVKQLTTSGIVWDKERANVTTGHWFTHNCLLATRSFTRSWHAKNNYNQQDYIYICNLCHFEDFVNTQSQHACSNNLFFSPLPTQCLQLVHLYKHFRQSLLTMAKLQRQEVCFNDKGSFEIYTPLEFSQHNWCIFPRWYNMQHTTKVTNSHVHGHLTIANTCPADTEHLHVYKCTPPKQDLLKW